MENDMTIAVDAANDIYLVNGDIATSAGNDARAQIISAIIRTRRGELQLDTDRGIPYLETIFNSAGKRWLDLWEGSVRTAIRECEFVDSILSFDYSIDYERSSVSYRAVVKTVDGDTIEVAQGQGI